MYTSPEQNGADYGATQCDFVRCVTQPRTARKAASNGLHLACMLCRQCGEGDGRAHDQLPEDRETGPHGHVHWARETRRDASLLQQLLLPIVRHLARVVRSECMDLRHGLYEQPGNRSTDRLALPGLPASSYNHLGSLAALRRDRIVLDRMTLLKQCRQPPWRRASTSPRLALGPAVFGRYLYAS